ncbi:MAG: hypothetical protein ACLP02_02790 [Rhodomicrobium sp.]
MPFENIELPAGPTTIPATLFYLTKDGASDIGYLQRVRSMKNVKGELLRDMEERYTQMTRTWSHQLASHIEGPVEAVVSPPSSRPYLAEPYRNAIRNKFAAAVDLTPRLTRSCEYFSGEGATFDAMMQAVSYESTGAEPQYRTLVIVDDILATGRTAALVVCKVRAAGFSDGAQIFVAAPLWLPGKGA